MKLEFRSVGLLVAIVAFVQGAPPLPLNIPGCSPVCTLEFAPVCGSDFTTYPNMCSLNYANCMAQNTMNKNVRKMYDGDCPSAGLTNSDPNAPCSDFCTFEYNPVCGTNGRTYSNPCAFKADACKDRKRGRITLVAKFGKCLHDCLKACPLSFKPVCGSNGISYPNSCLLEMASCTNEASKLPKITMAKEGLC